MAEVCFDRADGDGRQFQGAATQDFAERFHLDRIAERSSCTVRLDHADVVRGDTSLVASFANEECLSPAAWRSEATAAAIVIDGASANHRKNAVPSFTCVSKTFQCDNAQPSERT